MPGATIITTLVRQCWFRSTDNEQKNVLGLICVRQGNVSLMLLEQKGILIHLLLIKQY